MATNIRREAVIDSWSTIIEQAAGQDKRLMEDMTRFITEANMPDVTLVRDECTMGMFGSKRDLLILKHEQHSPTATLTEHALLSQRFTGA